MPPKKDPNSVKKEYFTVAYITDTISVPRGDENRLVIAPASYINDDYKLTYIKFPITEDRKQLLRTFLVYPPPDLPPEWPTYDCVPIISYATLQSAENKLQKLLSDRSAIKVAVAKGLAAMEAKPSKKIPPNPVVLELQKNVEDSLQNLPLLVGLNSAAVKGLVNDSSHIASLQVKSTSADDNNTIVQSGEPSVPRTAIEKENGNFQSLEEDTLTGYNQNNQSVTSDVNNSYTHPSFESVNSESIVTEQELDYHVNGKTLAEDKVVILGEMDIISTLNSMSAIIENSFNTFNQLIFDLNAKIDNLHSEFNIVKGQFSKAMKEMKTLGTKFDQDKVSNVMVITKLAEIQNTITEKRPFRDNEEVMSLERFDSIHKITLCLKTFDDFIKFEEKLKDEESPIRADLKKHFLTIISKTTKTEDMITIIFKGFFKKEALENIVAQQSRGSGKLELNSTAFYAVLKEAYVNIFAVEFRENVLLQAISKCIKNSQDWGGRKKKSTGPTETQTTGTTETQTTATTETQTTETTETQNSNQEAE